MKSPLLAMLTGATLVGLVVAALVFFDVDEQLLEVLRWIDQQGNWSAAFFIAIMAFAVVFLLPGVLFTTGAGFVFGVVTGTVYVVLGTTLGAVFAFLIARYLLGDKARGLILRHAGLQSVTAEMEQHDFQVVLLTRLIPFFPGKLSNYFFGLTGFSLGNFSLASLIGLIPFSLHNVYLGSLAANLMAIDDQQFGRTPVEWSIYGLGFVATVCAIFYLNKLARRALAEYTPEIHEEA